MIRGHKRYIVWPNDFMETSAMFKESDYPKDIRLEMPLITMTLNVAKSIRRTARSVTARRNRFSTSSVNYSHSWEENLKIEYWNKGNIFIRMSNEGK